MSLELVTPPAVEPVTLAEAKAQLKLDTTDDDDLVTSLIAAARIRAEWITRRAFVTQSWLQWFDAWPTRPLELALPPLQSVTAITAYAQDDTPAIIDASLYRLDAAAVPARIAWIETLQPPTALRGFKALSVAFTCGYGDAVADVPEPIRRAILMIVADLHAHRGDEAATPAAALALLEPYKVMTV